MFPVKIFGLYVIIVNTFSAGLYASPYEHREVSQYPAVHGHRSAQGFPVSFIPHPFPTSGFLREKTMTFFCHLTVTDPMHSN